MTIREDMTILKDVIDYVARDSEDNFDEAYEALLRLTGIALSAGEPRRVEIVGGPPNDDPCPGEFGPVNGRRKR
jgi:hypothetical protein